MPVKRHERLARGGRFSGAIIQILLRIHPSCHTQCSCGNPSLTSDKFHCGVQISCPGLDPFAWVHRARGRKASGREPLACAQGGVAAQGLAHKQQGRSKRTAKDIGSPPGLGGSIVQTERRGHVSAQRRAVKGLAPPQPEPARPGPVKELAAPGGSCRHRQHGDRYLEAQQHLPEQRRVKGGGQRPISSMISDLARGPTSRFSA